MKNVSLIGVFAAIVLAGIGGCTDMGSNVPQQIIVPAITAIQPDSAFAGDTLDIFGTNFGATQGSSAVSVGGTIADTVYLWSATKIDVKVPASAATGSVTVTVGGAMSNASAFKVRGTVVPSVSFENDVFPIFQSKINGCVSCHGGNGGLTLDTYTHLMQGGSVGPVVIPGNGEGSVIIKKLRGTAGFGSRMPLGGSPLPDATIALISLWITQGALNN